MASWYHVWLNMHDVYFYFNKGTLSCMSWLLLVLFDTSGRKTGLVKKITSLTARNNPLMFKKSHIPRYAGPVLLNIYFYEFAIRLIWYDGWVLSSRSDVLECRHVGAPHEGPVINKDTCRMSGLICCPVMLAVDVMLANIPICNRQYSASSATQRATTSLRCTAVFHKKKFFLSLFCSEERKQMSNTSILKTLRVLFLAA